jgi:hypothetical protein
MIHVQQSGAVEAFWAHNPEVRGSKPRSANIFRVMSVVCFIINENYFYDIVIKMVITAKSF